MRNNNAYPTLLAEYKEIEAKAQKSSQPERKQALVRIRADHDQDRIERIVAGLRREFGNDYATMRRFIRDGKEGKRVKPGID